MTSASDVRPATTERTIGAIARDYLVLIKPSIILLLLITTIPAMVLATDDWPDGWLVTATLIGGILAAGGAGAVNMYIDREIDDVMVRTRSRPIPSGRVPAHHAAIVGWTMGVASGFWLVATVNVISAVLAVGAFFFYVVVYSMWLKRTTVHNTVLGGVAGAAPPLIGWAAVTGSIEWTGVLLFLVVFAWQPPHFWALALVLADDYRDAKIPMLPAVRGEDETKRQTLLWSVLTLAVTLALGITAELNVLYFAVAIAGGVGFVYVAWRLYRTPGIEAAPAMFRYSTSYLALLFGAMAVDRLLFT
jgi:protoheme IX farnesyltransferase